MIITLITIGIAVAGIIMLVFEHRTHKFISGLYVTGFFMTFFGILAVIITTLFILRAEINPEVHNYKKKSQRDAYIEILQSENKVYLTSDFYESVIDFNEDIYRYRKWGNNSWTNWFWSDKEYEGVEPIEIFGGQK